MEIFFGWVLVMLSVFEAGKIHHMNKEHHHLLKENTVLAREVMALRQDKISHQNAVPTLDGIEIKNLSVDVKND